MIEKKHRTNRSVVWPTTSYFTLQQLFDLNPEFKEITLRVRFSEEIKLNKIAEIGVVSGGKGRPPKVFAYIPVTQITLQKAQQSGGICLIDNAEKLINVVSVNSSTSLPVSSVALVAPVAPVSLPVGI